LIEPSTATRMPSAPVHRQLPSWVRVLAVTPEPAPAKAAGGSVAGNERGVHGRRRRDQSRADRHRGRTNNPNVPDRVEESQVRLETNAGESSW
jgi:hypothetical protein